MGEVWTKSCIASSMKQECQAWHSCWHSAWRLLTFSLFFFTSIGFAASNSSLLTFCAATNPTVLFSRHQFSQIVWSRGTRLRSHPFPPSFSHWRLLRSARWVQILQSPP